MASFSRFRPHPWHGVAPGPRVPDVVHAYVEITPFSTIKYEVDKATGYLKVDRPQRSSSLPPGPYGFVPRTYCGERVAALGGTPRGDGDPLDICVISERVIDCNDILLTARPIGGLLMVDGGEADDKILAVLDQDALWSGVEDISQLPAALVQRWRHYFLTYKLEPGGSTPVTVASSYGAERAGQVIRASLEDYSAHFPEA